MFQNLLSHHSFCMHQQKGRVARLTRLPTSETKLNHHMVCYVQHLTRVLYVLRAQTLKFFIPNRDKGAVNIVNILPWDYVANYQWECEPLSSQWLGLISCPKTCA